MIMRRSLEMSQDPVKMGTIENPYVVVIQMRKRRRRRETSCMRNTRETQKIHSF